MDVRGGPRGEATRRFRRLPLGARGKHMDQILTSMRRLCESADRLERTLPRRTVRALQREFKNGDDDEGLRAAGPVRAARIPQGPGAIRSKYLATGDLTFFAEIQTLIRVMHAEPAKLAVDEVQERLTAMVATVATIAVNPPGRAIRAITDASEKTDAARRELAGPFAPGDVRSGTGGH